MLSFHCGAKESHSALGQLTVTDFRWQTTLMCVCVDVDVCVCETVGVHVHLIQFITICRGAVTTQIAKWKMTQYICIHVYMWACEHMSSLSDLPVPVLWIHRNNSAHIANVQSLDRLQIKNPVFLCRYLFIRGWFLLNQQANLWLIASGFVCMCVCKLAVCICVSL